MRAAVETQQAVTDHNADVPADRRIVLRIGINLGDVVIDGDDIQGDGVNLAARLKSMAAPGGICVSGMVYEGVRDRIDVPFEDLGEQEIKNFDRPVRVWQWVADTAAATVLRQTDNPLPLPDKPSIAVLPFDNMSGDPDQDSFAEGLTEDLITDLSKVSGLFVVARNSSFAYKGRPTEIRAVAAELGVRYVLEGSVRKSGARVRINAQLIDAETGGHIWADRYDGSVENAFELQDEVGAKVVSALSVRLTRREAENLKRVHTRNLEAYELFVSARATPYPPIPERITTARKMFERVIEMDPDFAGGYAGVSAMLSFGAMWSHGDNSEVITRAFDMAEKAVLVDDTFGWGHMALGWALLFRRQYGDAIAAAREAITRQPNDADAHAYHGFFLGLDGQDSLGVEALNKAIRLNPRFFNGPYLNMLAANQMLAGNYGASIECYLENESRRGPFGPPAFCWAVAAFVGLARQQEAADLTALLRQRFPKFIMTGWNYFSLIRDDAVRDRVKDLMRTAGVPED